MILYSHIFIIRKITTMTNKTNSKSNSRSRHIYIYILLFGLLITASFLSVMLGSVYINPADILKCFFTPDKTSVTYILIMNIRLPRMLGAIIAGMGLSVAGVILQGVMNNALASPNTIGVNSGAGFFVMLAMMLFPHSGYATSIASFVGALLTTLAIYALAYMADSSRTTIILAGITVSSFLNAGINTIKLINTDITIMSGLVVSFAGLLSFIGLIVPHICRTLFGSDARYLLPTSALLGASFVLICDIIGRLIAAPYELPAGIIMAFIGGPFFMYLLLKKKGGRRINA